MKPNNMIIGMAILIIPLAILAAGYGVFWQGSGEPYRFDTLHGQTVTIDPIMSAIVILISFSGIIPGNITLRNIRD